MFKDKKFLKEIAIILIVGIIVNAFCFLMPLVVNAAGEENSYYPFYWGTNEIGYQEDIDQIIGFMSDNNSEFWGYDNCFIRVVKENNGFYDTIYYAVYYYSDYWRLVADVNQSQPYSFDIQKVSNEQGTDAYTTVTFARGFNNTQYLQKVFSSANFQNCQSSNYNHIISYYSTFNTLYDFYDNVIITSPQQDIIPGDFTDLPSLDSILNNLTDTYTPDYSPVYPNIDQSKTDLENEQSFFYTLSQGINSNFNNLGSNLQKFFNKLQQKLTDVSNSVSTNIYNGFSTLMSNIQGFFGPKIDAIIEKLNYIIEPFDSQKLVDNLNNADFSSDFLGLITTVSTFSTAFTSGSEPNSCSFTLDFSNSYYDFGVCEFSFDWILPFRSTIRLIVGCLCVYSLIVSIFTSLNTYIGGTSSINDDI